LPSHISSMEQMLMLIRPIVAGYGWRQSSGCKKRSLQSRSGGQRCLVGTKAARVRCYAAEAVLVARRYVETMGGVAFIKIDFKMLSIRYAETRSWSYSSD